MSVPDHLPQWVILDVWGPKLLTPRWVPVVAQLSARKFAILGGMFGSRLSDVYTVDITTKEIIRKTDNCGLAFHRNSDCVTINEGKIISLVTDNNYNLVLIQYNEHED